MTIFTVTKYISYIPKIIPISKKSIRIYNSIYITPHSFIYHILFQYIIKVDSVSESLSINSNNTFQNMS